MTTKTEQELWTIGAIGTKEEGEDLILYQCPRCKTVVLDTGYDTKYCEICKLRDEKKATK
jgi:hypothetical protein